MVKVQFSLDVLTAADLSLAGPWALTVWGPPVRDLKLQITQYLLHIFSISLIFKNGYMI